MEVGAQLFERGGVAEFERVLPIEEVLPIDALCRHEERIILAHAALYEGAEVLAVEIEARERLAQGDVALVIERTVRDGATLVPRGEQLLLGEQPLPGKQVEIDEIGIARRAGDRAVRRIAVARLRQGQHLPILYPVLFEDLCKTIRLFAERTDAVFSGKGGNMAQNARSSACFHGTPLSECLFTTV